MLILFCRKEPRTQECLEPGKAIIPPCLAPSGYREPKGCVCCWKFPWRVASWGQLRNDGICLQRTPLNDGFCLQRTPLDLRTGLKKLLLERQTNWC